MEQNNAFGSGGTMQIAGTTYILSKFELDDGADLMAWAKQQLKEPFHIVKEALEILRPEGMDQPEEPKPKKAVASMNQQEKQEYAISLGAYKRKMKEWAQRQMEWREIRDTLLLDAKEDSASPNSVDKKAAHAVMQSFEGMCYQLYLSIRHKHPDIKFEVIRAGLGKMGLSEIETKIRAINSIDPSVLEELEAKKPETAEQGSPVEKA